MKLIVQKGKTSFLACIFIQDSSSTVGAGLSGLVFNTSGLVCYRARADDGNAAGTQITLATATLGTWATGGFKEKDTTNMKGVYEIGITNASLATGSDYCILYFSGATNMAPLVLEIQLVAFDPDAATNLGLTAIPTANPGAAGGLFIAGTNAATTITSAGGDALTLSSTGANGNGLNISGNGSGHAFKMTGGATGNAMTLIGGATSGDGLNVATTSGHGFNIAATGSSKHGITATGGNAGTSDGIKGVAGTGGVDIRGNITGNITGTLATVTTLTNLPSIPANWLTAAGIAAAALNGKGDWMVSYTQPTGFLAATFPSGTVANTTNITSITGNITGNLSGSVGSVTARVTANTDQINGNATAAANLEENVENCPRGTCSGGTNTTSVVSSMTTPASLTATGQLVGRTIVFDWDTTTAALQGQASNITNSTTGATPTITFGALTAGTVPANGDTFSIV